MCGIFGWENNGRELTEKELSEARNATGALFHRGPDGGGEWQAPGVYMGHRRLKIIDLSDNAAQPFRSSDGRHVMAYNGEIFNYIELRAELESEGARFHTSSDTEVFIEAYSRWGVAAFNRFEGMFAGALHDTSTGEHIIFRDPLGQKPMYYFDSSDCLIYGSELRSLTGLSGFDWRLDRKNFASYLLHAYYVRDTTPVQGVRKLLPGHFLRRRQGRSELVRYFRSIPGEDTLVIGPEEAVDEIERRIDHACEISLRADVPYGVFLSGGVDSSLILSSCHATNPDVAAFSVSMEEPDYDESAKAVEVARFLGVKNHRIYRLGNDTLEECFDLFLNSLDEPHGDAGYVNAIFLSKACRGEITVALAGDGGDELFAGYVPFHGLRYLPLLRLLPATVVTALQGLARTLLPGTDAYLGLQFKVLSYLQGAHAAEGVRFPLWLGCLSLEELARLCPDQPAVRFDRQGAEDSLAEYAERLQDEMHGKTRQQQLLHFYQQVFLPEFVCMHTDRASMRFGLEARCPLLNASVVTFANRLPDSVRTCGGSLKWPLKRILARRGFPQSILNQSKRGFTFPVARWLKTKLRPAIEALREDKELHQLVDKQTLNTLIDDHLAGRRNVYRILFNLITFCAWRKNLPGVRLV